jgi:hypothetical protein
MSTADLERLSPRERAYVENLDPEEQAVVLPTLARYRRPDRLGVGDRVPALDLFRLADGVRTRLDGLAGPQPLVLVFGSFT